MDQQQSIIDFWFPDNTKQRFWFKRDPEVDKVICHKFRELGETLTNNVKMRQQWINESAKGCFAIIIMFDQLTRHIYNDKRGDNIAFTAAQSLIDKDYDLELLPHQRAFALMPFRHKYNVTNDPKWLNIVIQRIESYTMDDIDDCVLHNFIMYTRGVIKRVMTINDPRI